MGKPTKHGKTPVGVERGVMFKKYGLTWGELPWLALEGLIKALLILSPGKKMTVEEYNQEGPRNYVPHKDR